jgi:hypothetical protein
VRPEHLQAKKRNMSCQHLSRRSGSARPYARPRDPERGICDQTLVRRKTANQLNDNEQNSPTTKQRKVSFQQQQPNKIKQPTEEQPTAMLTTTATAS